MTAGLENPPDAFDNTEDGPQMGGMLQFPVAHLSHMRPSTEPAGRFALPDNGL